MKPVDTPCEVRKGEEINIRKLRSYLKEHLPGADGEMNVKQFPSGFSNLTYLIAFGSREFVLRRPPMGTKAKTAHDMNREYRILKSISDSFARVPRPLHYCDDPEVIGSRFYIMERLSGIVLRKEIPQGVLETESEVRTLCRNWIKVLNDLHTLDYRACGLEDLGRPEGYVRRQVEGWAGRYRNARTEDVPDFEHIMDWLMGHMPDDHPNPALIHNDYKFDNVFLDPMEPTRIIGVVDWEMATIGDPLMDLGASLAYWIEHDDPEETRLIATLPTAHPGMLRRREIVALYEDISGSRITGFEFYYCFGLFRLAVIAQQIYYRYYHGQTRDTRFKNLAFFIHILEKTAGRAMEQRF